MSDAYREIFDLTTGEVKGQKVDPKTQRVGVPYQLPAAARTVPWACKQWPAFTEEDKAGLRAWLEPANWNGDAEKLLGYKKYLRDWSGVPCEWLEITPQS